MQPLRQLVSGTDFSEGAEQALELAIELARAAGARITLVHVCELTALELDEQRLGRCAAALAETIAKHRWPRVEIMGVLRSGTAWQKLDNVAAEVGASLIVVGRSGAGRGSRNELGSVAAQLVRCASRPVLTVAADFNCLDVEA